MESPYRYALSRMMSPPPGPAPHHTVVFVMLNPSTADATVDDPTIRRCKRFARDWAFGYLHVVNLFAWRATDPSAMRAAFERGEDVVGPMNDQAIADALSLVDGSGPKPAIIAAWGAVHAFAKPRAQAVLAMMRRVGSVHCLGKTLAGQPRHPLFVRADATPQLF